MKKTNDGELPIFVKWIEFLKWLLPVTEKFPQKIRFTFANRIDNIALDIAENIVEARYASEKAHILKDINIRLEKLRILLRICHELRYLSYKSYEKSIRDINETGKMLGGWIKSVSAR